MAGLSDIPCVGNIVDRISEYIVDGLFRGSRYLLCTNNLVKDLNSQIKKAEILENEFTRKVNEATSDGKKIEAHVLEWQKKVENIKTQASDISGRETSSTCFRGLHFPNPVARFRLGRRAADLAKTVIEEINSGKEHLDRGIAHHPPTEPVPNSDTPYQIFDSRQEAYAKLWDSIVKEDGSTVLGIYGMAGAGKTRMMEQIRDKAKEKGIFKKVTQANIGQTFDVIKLQGQLAGSLDCQLKSTDDIVARASQLRNSLKSGVKTLVILDDVWDDINLNVIGIPTNEIGIPFTDETSKGCKILLTSRIKDVCLLYKCEDPIEITSLTDTEAWEMFMNTVGKSKIESFDDTMLADKVCKQCGSLPLLILAVGKSLRLGDESAWRDALSQLENPKFEDINRIDQKAYACLQLSFLKLEEGAKRCLLLCGLFPEDADINTKLLFDIATASELLMPGRDIHALVEALKSASLLLQGKGDDTVKVHDIIRDVARYIAAMDPEYAFLFVRCQSTKWPKNGGYPYPSRKLLHVDLGVNNVQFPHHLVCQNLHTLWLQCNNHLQNRLSSFFEGFSNLRVVVLQGMRLSEQQFSIHTLEELTMLTLEHCDIDQIFLNSVSKTLETLCIWKCSLPVPLDIPEFKELRKLELVSKDVQADVVCGISKLTSLEELTIPSGFKTKEDEYTSISAELSTLNCLRKLMIPFRKSESFPSHSLDNLVDFNIVVGGINFLDYRWLLLSDRRRISIKRTKIVIESGWMGLLEKADAVEVYLAGLPNNGLGERCNMREREAFANLRVLRILECGGMEHIARWDGRSQHLTCFTNLQTLRLTRCNGMEYAFSSRVANCLLQLHSLRIDSCYQIKEIVRVDDGQDIICFPKLILLHLENLPKLTSLYNNQVEFPQLSILKVYYCSYLEIVIRCAMLHGFQNLALISIRNCDSLRTVFHHSSPAESTMVFPALKELELSGLSNLESFLSYDNEILEIDDSRSNTLFTTTVFRSFQQLQEIHVVDCYLLKGILENGGGTHGINPNTPISLLLLKSLTLSDLPNLQNCGIFACYTPALSAVEVNNCAISSLFTCSASRNLQNLKSLKIKRCHRLEQIFADDMNDETPGSSDKTPGSSEKVASLCTCSAFRNLQILKSLKIKWCHMLEQIVADDMDDETPGPRENLISLPLLETIELKNLQGLKSFSSNSSFTFSMPVLNKIKADGCPCMDKFAFSQITATLIEGDLNDYICEMARMIGTLFQAFDYRAFISFDWFNLLRM